MSSEALSKQKSSRSSLGQMYSDVIVQNSQSEIFELEPKPKLCCIPENCKRIWGGLRKTQSLNGNSKHERPEKSCSVLFVSSRSRTHSKGVIM